MKSNQAFLQQSKNVASNGNEIQSSIFTAIKKMMLQMEMKSDQAFLQQPKMLL
jgi:hypothetical protein